MDFQNIPPVETGPVLLDRAIKDATKRATMLSRSLRKSIGFTKQRHVEREKLKYLSETLAASLEAVPKPFPSLDRLSEFYSALMDATLDRDRLRKDLAACSWASGAVLKLAREFSSRMGKAQDREQLMTAKREAIGRISSMVRQVSKSLVHLDQCRKIMRTYPSIKDGLYTVAIAGFPNVGKSTLLSRLTTARPEIKNYAFTTKTLNIGYMTHRHNKVQFIDTPGTLVRPEQMNNVERQAYLAMKYASHLVVYVYDPTETYPLELQERLEENVKEFGKDTLIFVSKTDVAEPGRVAAFCEKRPEAIVSLDELQARITAIFEEEHLGLK